MGSIIEALVPPFSFDECVQQILDCEGEPSAESGSGNLDVIFPEFTNKFLPMMGGSISRFDLSSWGLSQDPDSELLVSRALSSLDDLQLTNDLDSLNLFRVTLNKELFRMREFKILESNASVKAPKMFFSYFQGDDLLLDEEKSSPYITRICKFKHIPYLAFKVILNKVVPAEETEDDFGKMVGASGKTFRELLAASENPNENDIIDLMTEMFTIFNINEDDIVKGRGPAAEGGYYTIFDKKIYIKMPDLTARDSAGFYSDIFDDDSNFYIEASKNRKSYGRGKFLAFALPVLATVDDGGVPLPDFGSVEITIDTATEAGDIKAAYLSILTVGQDAQSSKKSVDFFSDSLELFSIPMLTVNDLYTGTQAFGRKPTVEYNLEPKQGEIEFYLKPEDAAISLEVGSESAKDTGIPFVGGEYSAESFFGEKNRPEILLANPESPISVPRNDRRYFSAKAYGSIPVLANMRPKLVQTVPSRWIKSLSAKAGDEDQVILEFNSSDFSNVNFDALGNEASFALYLEDNFGQITKAAGENIVMSSALPSLTRISPDGYRGSEELLSDGEGVTLRFTGEGLTNTIGIRVSIKGTTISTDYLFSDPLLQYSGSSTLSTLKVNAQLSYIGLEPGQEYELSFLSLTNEDGNRIPIYINTAEGEEQIGKVPSLARFKTNEFSVKKFNSGYVSEIPILTDTSAVLRLKSRQRLFSGEYEIYAYIGIKESEPKISKAIGGDDVVQFNALGSTFYIPYNLEYDFSTSFASDFGRQFFNSRANLSIPGGRYQKYNLFPLLDTPVGSAIIFYNKKITEDASGGVVVGLDGNYAVTYLGDPDGRKPFILGPTVLGLVVDNPGGLEYLSTFAVGENETGIRETFSEKTFKTGPISIYQKITKLGIIFSSSKASNLRRQLTFYIGGTKLSGISEKIKDIGGGRYLATFRNVAIKEEGVLEVRVEKKDKIFRYTSSGFLSKRASFPIASGEYSYNVDDNELTLNSSVSEFYPTGIVDVENNPIDLLIPGGNAGILINQASSTELTYKFLYPLTVRPNVSTEVFTDNLEVLIGGAPNEINQLARAGLTIQSGEILTGSSFHINDSGNAIGFLEWDLTDAAVIKSNVAEVELIYPTIESATAYTPDQINGSLLKAGTEIKIKVRNTKKNFKVIFNDLFAAKTKGIPKKIERGVYEARVVVPAAVIGSDCINICVSNKNSRRLGAKLAMGEKFVQNLSKNMEDKLNGFMKDKVPDIEDLKELIRKFPLRFLNLKLDKSLVPIDLINSFCDFSWHLTADLKLALNGFQTLLIPIQVILCIIDVICSLLHPGKLGRAVIRLFYCLYDLLLLLPQISVPVMFLNLILHLLQLLECVILKIIEIITAINDIIRAIEIARQQELWDALITLEEVISEYLFELNVDLDVLEPIITILAIFLQILELIFNFPCPPDDGIGDKSCGIQGSMLAGIVAGKVSPGDGAYDTSVLLPIAQYFTNDTIESRVIANEGSTYQEFSPGNKIVGKGGEDNNFYGAMSINEETLRTTNGIGFQASFAASFTRSSKGLGEPTVVKFKFNDRLKNEGRIFKKKILDPLLNRDAPIRLMEKEEGFLKVASGKGNFVSPLDGETFIRKNDDKGTVLPLTLTFDISVFEPNPETGELEETVIEQVTRTFDDIPKLAIMDEEANLYFIEPDGIEFDSDDNIDAIKARIINDISAPKLKLSREDQDVDTTGDGVIDENDEEARVFDLPQMFFVDMRSIADELQSACYPASFNGFLLEDEETGDTDDIAEIVQDASDCIEEYTNVIRDMITKTRESLDNGEVPAALSLDTFADAHQTMIDCLEGQVDNICKFVINPLNSSFLIEEDDDFTALDDYPEEVFDPVEFGTLRIRQQGPAFTGAREYAGGIGDSHVLGVGKIATIRITPRDSYDLEMPGDLREKIKVNIISDTTGTARILENEDGTIISQEGLDYYVKIIADKEGEVKLTASVCGRTIAAVTYAGIQTLIEEDPNCVPEAPASEVEEEAVRPGALIKVDRVLSLYYLRIPRVATVKPDDADIASSDPQVFGTSLEN